MTPARSNPQRRQKTPWRTESIPKDCLKAAESLQEFAWLEQFYLAGGTALALTLGHRISVDLDFFSETNQLRPNERHRIISDLTRIGAKIQDESEGTVHAVLGNTAVSFFRYGYPCVRPLKRWKNIGVADPADIGLMKLGAVMGRGSKKDFYDLYALLHGGYELPQLLRLSRKKFKGHADFPFQALKALVYFDDADSETAPRMTENVPWTSVKMHIQKEVHKASRLYR